MALRRKDDPGEDARTVARVTGALEGYVASAGQGVQGVQVSVAHVLDLLNPRGLWRFDPERRTGAAEPVAVRPDDADPITGCRSAAAPSK